MGRGITHFHGKLAGVSHKNPDGSSRQKIIARCQPLEQLQLVHEEDNQHDPNAVAVKRANGEQVGYLPAHMAEEVVGDWKSGYAFSLIIKNLTGGKSGKSVRGVNFLMIRSPAGTSEAEAKRYAESLDWSDADAEPVIGGAPAQSSGCAIVVVLLLIVVGVIYAIS